MLILPIKKKWYDMILSGEKTEEYREIKPYYDNRLPKEFGFFREGEKLVKGNIYPPADLSEKMYAHSLSESVTRNGEQSPALNIMCCTSRKYRRRDYGKNKKLPQDRGREQDT